MRTKWLLMFPLLALSLAGQSYRPAPENLKAREWFQDAKFGMFIHWGVYSVLGDGEWVMHNRKMTIAEYEKLAPKFNPTEFNAAEWVALAKEAGMRYITFTSKHHDGFAMWPMSATNRASNSSCIIRTWTGTTRITIRAGARVSTPDVRRVATGTAIWTISTPSSKNC